MTSTLRSVLEFNYNLRYTVNTSLYRNSELYTDLEMEGRSLRFRCSECNYETIKKIHLKVHIDLVHKKIKHQCPECNYEAIKKSHLEVHIDSVHKKIKHQCPECGKELSDKSGLNRHKKFVHKSGTQRDVRVHTPNVHGITRTICCSFFG